jgi:exopolysaccharide biosynthesis protein
MQAGFCRVSDVQVRRVRATRLAVAAAAVAATLGAGLLAGSPARADDTTSWLPTTPLGWPLAVDEQTGPSQEITRGLLHSTDTLDTVGGRQIAQVLHVDTSDPNLREGVVEAGDRLIDPSDETVSSMADRTGAVAGINGDFFAINSDGDPTDMVIQNGKLLKSPNPGGHPAAFGIEPDGQMVITTETYTGTVTDGSASHALASVNTVDPEIANGITRVTPDLGAATIAASTVVAGHLDPTTGALVVDSVKTGVTSLPQLAAGEEDLVGAGTGGTWLDGAVHVGDTLQLSEALAPYDNLQTAVGGGAFLVRNGQMDVSGNPSELNINDPVTGLGITADGRHAIVAVFDGHQSENSAEGLTEDELAQWMIEHGAVNAIEFDSGGSSEMVGRLPGQSLSVLNTPSDGDERPVANGLFFYSNETSPTAATSAVVNQGKALAVLAGSSVPVSAYATDADGNPSAQPPAVSAAPAALASISGGTLIAGRRAGAGRLIATAGRARSSAPLLVLSRLRSLTLSPSQSDLGNGATQQFIAAATGGDGTPATLDPADVHWTVSPSGLGGVSAGGLFTAALTGSGLATVTATAGGVSARTTVAVGTTPQMIDPMTDVTNWTAHGTGGATASLSESTTELAQPGDAGSMDVHYSIPAGSGDKQVVFEPTVDESFPGAGASQDPEAVGLWVKGQGTSDDPSAPLSDGNLTLAESYAQINGQAVTFYPTTVTYSGWRLIVAPLPAGTLFPLKVSFLDFLVISPTSAMSGDLYVSDLEALYAPRPSTTDAALPSPDNPRWLSAVDDPAQFAAGGSTLALLGGASLSAADPSSTGAEAMAGLPAALAALPGPARPDAIQALGGMSATGSSGDLSAVATALKGDGAPSHSAVGAGETSDGADPENGNFASVFGATHYAYRLGAADVIVADDSQGGLTASDPLQSPAAEQYSWLVGQLSADRAPTTIVALSLPAIDPRGIFADQFSDTYEGQEYEALLQRFQRTHPDTHVIALAGQDSGYFEQLVGDQGAVVPFDGLPNLSVGDLGTAPGVHAGLGGFLDYGLLHVTAGGAVQYAVEPVLSSITASAPATALRSGVRELLGATGRPPQGDDPSVAPVVPITDPVAHRWSSSDPAVATVDPRTGAVQTRRPGMATITVTSDGVSGAVGLTVAGR